jgi:ArsR family transcriptional regulator, nickel/cobalt-responsive transcriptional repressor
MIRCVSHGVQRRTRSAPLDAPTAQQVADTMQALSTPSRVRILGRLRESPCSVGELAEAVSMERSAVSHQLRLLRHLGLVTGERRGRSILYALHDPHVGVLLEEAIYHVEHVRLGFSAGASEAATAS